MSRVGAGQEEEQGRSERRTRVIAWQEPDRIGSMAGAGARQEQIIRRRQEQERGSNNSNGQRYPRPCCTHFGNLKRAQQVKGYC